MVERVRKVAPASTVMWNSLAVWISPVSKIPSATTTCARYAVVAFLKVISAEPRLVKVPDPVNAGSATAEVTVYSRAVPFPRRLMATKLSPKTNCDEVATKRSNTNSVFVTVSVPPVTVKVPEPVTRKLATETFAVSVNAVFAGISTASVALGTAPFDQLSSSVHCPFLVAFVKTKESVGRKVEPSVAPVTSVKLPSASARQKLTVESSAWVKE